MVNGGGGRGVVGFHLMLGQWGSIIYGFIPFGSWGKISAGTMSCLLLQLQYSYMLIYLFFL